MKGVENVTSEKEIQSEESSDPFPHILKEGETYYSLAKKYGVELNELLRLNQLTYDADKKEYHKIGSNKLYVPKIGDTVIIPDKASLGDKSKYLSPENTKSKTNQAMFEVIVWDYVLWEQIKNLSDDKILQALNDAWRKNMNRIDTDIADNVSNGLREGTPNERLFDQFTANPKIFHTNVASGGGWEKERSVKINGIRINQYGSVMFTDPKKIDLKSHQFLWPGERLQNLKRMKERRDKREDKLIEHIIYVTKYNNNRLTDQDAYSLFINIGGSVSGGVATYFFPNTMTAIYTANSFDGLISSLITIAQKIRGEYDPNDPSNLATLVFGNTTGKKVNFYLTLTSGTTGATGVLVTKGGQVIDRWGLLFDALGIKDGSSENLKLEIK
jgi:hypothetical protein